MMSAQAEVEMTTAVAMLFLLAGVSPTPSLSCPPGTKHREFRYTNGSREDWCVDRNGTRHGPAQSRYPNGVLTSEGEYTSGRVDGTWRYFYNNGVKWREDEWKSGELKSSWVNPIVYKLSPDELLALGAASCGGVGEAQPKDKKKPQ